MPSERREIQALADADGLRFRTYLPRVGLRYRISQAAGPFPQRCIKPLLVNPARELVALVARDAERDRQAVQFCLPWRGLVTAVRLNWSVNLAHSFPEGVSYYEFLSTLKVKVCFPEDPRRPIHSYSDVRKKPGAAGRPSLFQLIQLGHTPKIDGYESS